MRLTTTSREARTWPRYLLWGRIRTSTVALLIAFVGTWWFYDEYRPLPDPPAPAQQVVPPGFIPDPSYTWVPRTEVQRETTTTTPTTSEAPTTAPTDSTVPSPSPSVSSSPTATSSPSPVPWVPPWAPQPTTAPATTAPATPSAAATPSVVPGAGPRSTPAVPTQ